MRPFHVTALNPAVPGGSARAGLECAARATSPASPARTGAHRPAAEVRRLVASALEQRRRLLRNGRGHMSSASMRAPFHFLEAWLQHSNDHLSAASLRDFWARHENDVRLVMPGTPGGARMLRKLQHLCA